MKPHTTSLALSFGTLLAVGCAATPDEAATEQSVTGSCAAPTTISSNGDLPVASVVGATAATDVDNSLSHNASDWTTSIGCGTVVYQLTGAGTTVTLTTRASGADWNGVLYVRSASQGCTTDPYAPITEGSQRVVGAAESVSFFAASGTTYYVSVGGYGVASSGTCSHGGSFVLNVAGLPSSAALPSYAQWANGTPEISQAVDAGWDWYNTGYPGTVSAANNATLSAGGVTPIAYINSRGVANSDTFLEGQVNAFFPGTTYNAIALCTVFGGAVTDVDVRDSRWQAWLLARANHAYDLGNRGIFWDEARVEDECGSWSGSATAQQQAIDALGAVMQRVHTAHPDMIQIVNQGLGVAQQYTSLVQGYTLENMLAYDHQFHDSYSTQEIAWANGLRDAGIRIIAIEYIDDSDFGCADTTCALANTLIANAASLGWIPYISRSDLNYEGRGASILPPW